jgi:hypothetical protein
VCPINALVNMVINNLVPITNTVLAACGLVPLV